MRRANKLGLLGVTLIALVAAFGLLVGSGASRAQAQAVGPCTTPTTVAPPTTACTFATTTTVVSGGTLTIATTATGVTITGVTPAGGGFFGGCAAAGFGGTAGIGTNTVTIGPCPAGTTIPAGSSLTVTFQCTTTCPATIPTTVTYNANTPVVPGTATAGACGTSAAGGPAFPVTCTNTTGAVAVGGQTVVLSVTGCALAGCSITAAPATAGTCPLTTGLPTAPGNPTSVTYSCLAGSAQTVASGTTIMITVATLGAGVTPIETTTAGAGPVAPTVTTVTFTVPAAPAASAQPTNEQKFCNNTTAGTLGLSQVIGQTTQPLSVTGPAISFTLPMFGPASTCFIQLYRGTAAGAPVPCNLTTNTCSDGNLIVTLSTGSGFTISCAGGALPAGQAFPAPVPAFPGNNGGTCQQQVQNTQLNLPCGTTAGTGAANTTASATCLGAFFDIETLLGACVTTPNACINPSLVGISGLNNFNAGATATLTIVFVATPANGGTVGGIQLGQNTFASAAPGLGTLLVTANPQLIPSNGTIASVITATFACNTGFNLVNGLPLSSTALTLSNLLGNNTLVVPTTSNVCGASLPGTFNFTTPQGLLFDNGRNAESISCGPNANVNAFGNGQPVFFPSSGTTFPLAFTCSGAAVLAIGVIPGDSPVNVSYQSAVGGLQAVGSTLVTVTPSGTPRISIACNPSTISAGNTGSICTATVTDLNGIPLTGSTGATVTFTTSDPTTTTILPCVLGTPGAINVTTSPQVLPLIQPNTPCVTPSGTIPGQVNTFINGQATALLVASSTAHPEVITVSATLGVLVPPSYACLAAPYLPQGTNLSIYGTTPAASGYYAPLNGVGLPGVTGCGTASPIGLTGLATALNGAGVGLTGIVTLPNATSASTTVNIGGPAGIQIAGATPISPIVLSRGCNSVIVTSPIGTPIANIAALVTPANAVVSIWRFNNGTKLFNAGFFSDPNAPTDFITTGYLSGTTAPNAASTIITGPNVTYTTGLLTNVPTSAAQITETYYVCVNAAATMISG